MPDFPNSSNLVLILFPSAANAFKAASSYLERSIFFLTMSVAASAAIMPFLGVTFLAFTLSHSFNKSSFIGLPKTSSLGPNTSSKYLSYSFICLDLLRSS